MDVPTNDSVHLVEARARAWIVAEEALRKSQGDATSAGGVEQDDGEVVQSESSDQ